MNPSGLSRRLAIHRGLAAMVAGGMPEECAKQAITLIAQRRIPHISINY